ncbi:MAG: helix-turn-helix transcriptional regulator [Planctomycetota bacterium]
MHELTDIATYWVLALGEGGVIEKCKLMPDIEGKNLSELCYDPESRSRWRRAFADCFTYGNDVDDIEVNLQTDDRPIDLVCSLENVGNNRILCYITRRFDLNRLTDLEKRALIEITHLDDSEKRILRKMADPNISDETLVKMSGLSPQSIRSAKRRIKKKLNIRRQEGLQLAAAQLVLVGSRNAK